MTDLTNHEPEPAHAEEPLLERADDNDLPAILDEVKIEEVSIDGMCGVY